MSYAPASHYDKVTDAWRLLLGEELHYGVFEDPSEDLDRATARLTERMLEAAQIEASHEVLDVGCGTGAPACRIAGQLGARVTGITTSEKGASTAAKRAKESGLSDRVAIELRDGMDNGFPAESFDRVWVLESSHLMRDRDRLLAECARVLRPGGRLALCDVIRRREMSLQEVKRLREPLALLRDVFGDARMEPLEEYARLASASGLEVETTTDLTTQTLPTFERWRENAERHRDRVVQLFGADELAKFVASSHVLEGFWNDGTLGYGLLAATKPGEAQ